MALTVQLQEEKPIMKFTLRFTLVRIFLWVGFCCLPALLSAQSWANSGQIGGQVLDPSGAPAAGVEVSVRNVDTNYDMRFSATDAEGRYAVLMEIPADFYRPSQEVCLSRACIMCG